MLGVYFHDYTYLSYLTHKLNYIFGKGGIDINMMSNDGSHIKVMFFLASSIVFFQQRTPFGLRFVRFAL